MRQTEKTKFEETLRPIPTCELQWELERREGVRSKRLGIDAKIEVVVDGSVWLTDRGPLTVSVNQD